MAADESRAGGESRQANVARVSEAHPGALSSRAPRMRPVALSGLRWLWRTMAADESRAGGESRQANVARVSEAHPGALSFQGAPDAACGLIRATVVVAND